VADVYMPRLSDSMEEGTVVRWLKASGEAVRRGEDLVEIETDKATVTFESEYDGELEIVAGPGATLAVGGLIAYVGDRSHPDGDSDGRLRAEPVPTEPASQPQTGRGQAAENVSPTARRLAEAAGVDLSQVVGSGPGGRITRADVAAAANGADVTTAATRVPEARQDEPAEPAKGQSQTRELTPTQRTIARRMAESRATIPDFTLDADIDIGAAQAALAQLRSGREPEARPTLTDLIVRACALTLSEFPAVNSAYRDGRVEEYSRVNIGLAVAADGALLVPTIFDADQKSVAEIARESRVLAARARNGTISPAELAGGTFTVSNLGMHGVRRFQAIINPPQAAILAVGALRPVPVIRQGALATQDTLTVSLSCDHRVLYGAEAAQFLKRLGALLGAPNPWCGG
jgi:pyruvate dehydrogenase E2 component (dihydrolipoamide acetyltransferase)